MKVVALTWVLLLLTGSQAQSLQDNLQSQWARVKDLAGVYMASIEESMTQLQNSSLGKDPDLNDLLESWETLRSTAKEIWNELKNDKELGQMLKESLEKVEQWAKPHLETFKKVQREMKRYHKTVERKAKQWKESMREKMLNLDDKVTNISTNVFHCLRREMQPFNDQVRHYLMDSLQENGKGLLELQSKAREELKKLQEMASPVLQGLHESLPFLWESLLQATMEGDQ